MNKLLIVFSFLTLALSGACYRYVPTERATAPPGSEVRAILTQDGISEMRRYFGPGVTSVEGPLVRWDEAGIGLLSEISMSRPGFPATTTTETLELLPHHLERMELRELDGKRTVGFAAGVVGVMAGALLAAQAIGGSSDDDGEGGGPEPEAAFAFRIPFGFWGR